MKALASRNPAPGEEMSALEIAVDAILEQAILDLQDLRTDLVERRGSGTIPDILQCIYGFAEQIQIRVKEHDASSSNEGASEAPELDPADLCDIVRDLTDECFQMMRDLHEAGERGWHPSFISKLTRYRDRLAAFDKDR